jgi:hypothetical protein
MKPNTNNNESINLNLSQINTPTETSGKKLEKFKKPSVNTISLQNETSLNIEVHKENLLKGKISNVFFNKFQIIIFSS